MRGSSAKDRLDIGQYERDDGEIKIGDIAPNCGKCRSCPPGAYQAALIARALLSSSNSKLPRAKVQMQLVCTMGAVLQLRPNCECCNQDLPPDSTEAMICSFECTFCQRCASDVLHGRCPNCGGEMVRRPIRPVGMLVQAPASTERIYNPGGCA